MKKEIKTCMVMLNNGGIFDAINPFINLRLQMSNNKSYIYIKTLDNLVLIQKKEIMLIKTKK